MNASAERFFVLTGGPGSGKSTLIAALAKAGHVCSVEAGRAIIQDQALIGGRALPSTDPAAFAELMLSWEMRSYRMAEAQSGSAFFDRGVPDVAGYLRLTGLPVPTHVEAAARAFHYNRRVFIAPPWPEIFARDRERRQSYDEAVRTCDAMVETYTRYGYELVELPRVPVEQRTRFILEHAGLTKPA